MYTFKKSRLSSNKGDLSQAIKGLKESQRTRRQKIETEQFKVEINKKAETDYSGNSGRALDSHRYRQQLWFSEILSVCSSLHVYSVINWHKPAANRVWLFYDRNGCTVTVSMFRAGRKWRLLPAKRCPDLLLGLVPLPSLYWETVRASPWVTPIFQLPLRRPAASGQGWQVGRRLRFRDFERSRGLREHM